MDEEGVFAVAVDYEAGTKDPSHVFKAMATLLDSMALLDQDLAASLGAKVRPVLLLERVEAGSIKTWLRTALESLEDEDIHDLNVRRGIGGFLVKAKRLVLRKLSDQQSISSRDQIREISAEIHQMAREVPIGQLPAPSPVPVERLLADISTIGSALANLGPLETAKYESDEGTIPFNPGLQLSSEAVEALLTRETITNVSEMILKVKRPDYLGSAQWEFRHQRHVIEAKLDDQPWLERFQTRQVTLLPGDALRAKVQSTIKYGHDGEVVATHYSVVEVLEVLRYDVQEQTTLTLLPPPNRPA